MFSQPCGKFSAPWIIDKEMFWCLLVLEEMNGAFDGVVIIVTFRPRFEEAVEP